MGSARHPLEAQAQATLVEIATLRGWQHYHTHDARKSRAGFPDLVLWRDRTVFAELKREGERPRPDQVEVLDGLARAGAEVYVWTIADLDEVVAVLARGVVWDRESCQLGPEWWWRPRTLWISSQLPRGAGSA